MPPMTRRRMDYNTWIGLSEMMLYVRARLHGNWRWKYNTGAAAN